MAKGTKRKRGEDDASSRKKIDAKTRPSPVRRRLLDQCYPGVSSLRDYLLPKLPGSSRLRRKKIASCGQGDNCSELETLLGTLLDTTLVGTSSAGEPAEDIAKDTRWEQWLSFSQRGDESYVTLSDGTANAIFSQSEIVDFAIWLLFSREKKLNAWPKQLLCDGFRRGVMSGDHVDTAIPDLFALYPNEHRAALKASPWPQLLMLLGKSGERIMMDLLLDCAIFVPVKAGFDNYYQRNGIPLSEIELTGLTTTDGHVSPSNPRKLSDITLVRSRIFYAKPALTARGLIQVKDVLNRCPYLRGSDKAGNTDSTDQRNELHTDKVLMYMFPRQFGLHNVFTSQVNTAQTAQKFHDYTLREEEISESLRTGDKKPEPRRPKVPKRLRGAARELARRLQILHGRCSYWEMLRHYCPSILDQPPRTVRSTSSRRLRQVESGANISTAAGQSQNSQPARRRTRKPHAVAHIVALPAEASILDLASPASQVSAFCQAILSKIIPRSFWGLGETQQHNLAVFVRKVDHFIRLRRFETMSLHEIAQDFKVASLPWLSPPNQQGSKTALTDMIKRYEIFNEFLYYVFDSLLIPLIRSNFYVTESNVHRYQIFYFRHDAWKCVAEPAVAKLKGIMFEEVKLEDALRILDSRRLSFSQLRLLPKGSGLRPIMNLRRRTLAKGPAKLLGPSINSVLGPVHTLLKLEKDINPSRLGSTMFSVSDMYSRLKAFKSALGPAHGKLYFAKVDVQAAFDTIPQDAVVKLMATIPSQGAYTITKHAEVKPGEIVEQTAGQATTTKPIRRWHATALPDSHAKTFPERLEDHAGSKKRNTVFVDSAMRKTHDTSELLRLLNEHVQRNIVKIGKKFYRQKLGIPQGSVLSSFLCNYFYADLEKQYLDFLEGPDCLLLRLIDDFLLITSDMAKAARFVQTMHRGMPEYGVQVNQKKTLVSFDMQVEGGSTAKISGQHLFPYCGTLIDTRTLDISRDRDGAKDRNASHSLTVDFGRSPGRNFQRKVLNAFKVQSHLMFFDTRHNAPATVLRSLRGALAETARKMCAYARCLPRRKRPPATLVARTVAKVVDVAFLLLTGASRRARHPGYECGLRRAQVAAVAYGAFLEVLGRKQTGYSAVVQWLRREAAVAARG